MGLAGLVGAGRTETAELLYGIEKIKSGKVYVRGNQVFPKSPVQAVRIGIGLVSEDRKSRDLLWTSQLLSIWWQSVSKRYFRTSLYQKRKLPKLRWDIRSSFVSLQPALIKHVNICPAVISRRWYWRNG